MAYLLLLGNPLYFVSGSTSAPPEISTIVPSKFPVTISERTTPSPDHSSTVTADSTSEPPEISTIVPSEFPVTISERTTPSPDHSSTVTAGKSTPEDCRLPGFLYRGKQRVTKSGILCQRWDVQSPHEHNYFIFSLAQENYCRNFDREEPWCFTTNSSVRWELCGVDICSSPCLNRSVDTQKIASQCFATEPTGIEFCSRLWRIVGCLKNRIEISTDIQCSGIELRSIALQRQDMLERLMGRSISQCIKAPCADSRLVSFERVVVLAFFCIVKHPMEETTSETLCRNFQRVGNCITSKINVVTNVTCPTKDKASMARMVVDLFQNGALQSPVNLSHCMSNISEFPMSTADSPTSQIVDQDTTEQLNQAQLFISIGSSVFVLFVGILIFSLLTMRKMLLKDRRKELRLRSVPRTERNPYVSNAAFSNDPYNDPDYDTIEEKDKGYEHLNVSREEHETPNDERMRVGSYVDPNNVEGNYLNVIHSSNERAYMDVNPYTELINDSFESTATTQGNDDLQENEEYSSSPEHKKHQEIDE